MKIILNHHPEEFNASSLTVSELLAIKKFTFKMLVIRINGKVIRKHEYPATLIKEGDDVTVLHLISGG